MMESSPLFGGVALRDLEREDRRKNWAVSVGNNRPLKEWFPTRPEQRRPTPRRRRRAERGGHSNPPSS
jgi:hypothetical protein